MLFNSLAGSTIMCSHAQAVFAYSCFQRFSCNIGTCFWLSTYCFTRADCCCAGAGDDSYFGSGTWISPSIDDIQQRWCAEIFDRPIGAPTGKAVKTDTVYKRSFATGTTVEFDVSTNTGTINWSS